MLRAAQDYFRPSPDGVRKRDILREFILQGGFKPGVIETAKQIPRDMVRFGISAIEAPKAIKTREASGKWYDTPIGRLNSFQSEAQNRVYRGDPLWKAIGNPAIETILGGADVASLAKLTTMLGAKALRPYAGKKLPGHAMNPFADDLANDYFDVDRTMSSMEESGLFNPDMVPPKEAARRALPPWSTPLDVDNNAKAIVAKRGYPDILPVSEDGVGYAKYMRSWQGKPKKGPLANFGIGKVKRPNYNNPLKKLFRGGINSGAYKNEEPVYVLASKYKGDSVGPDVKEIGKAIAGRAKIIMEPEDINTDLMRPFNAKLRKMLTERFGYVESAPGILEPTGSTHSRASLKNLKLPKDVKIKRTPFTRKDNIITNQVGEDAQAFVENTLERLGVFTEQPTPSIRRPSIKK